MVLSLGCVIESGHKSPAITSEGGALLFLSQKLADLFIYNISFHYILLPHWLWRIRVRVSSRYPLFSHFSWFSIKVCGGNCRITAWNEVVKIVWNALLPVWKKLWKIIVWLRLKGICNAMIVLVQSWKYELFIICDCSLKLLKSHLVWIHITLQRLPWKTILWFM